MAGRVWVLLGRAADEPAGERLEHGMQANIAREDARDSEVCIPLATINGSHHGGLQAALDGRQTSASISNPDVLVLQMPQDAMAPSMSASSTSQKMRRSYSAPPSLQSCNDEEKGQVAGVLQARILKIRVLGRTISINESLQVWATYVQEMFCLLGRGGAYLSSLMTAFVLGGFGAVMQERILWSCLAIVVMTPITSLAIRPMWLIICTHLQLQETSGLLSPSGTGESLATVVKIVLASNLLALVSHDAHPTDYLDGSSCSSSSCRQRARETLMAVCFFILFLEGLPALLSRANVVTRYRFWAAIIKRRQQHNLPALLKTILVDKQLHSHQASAVSVIIIVTLGLLLGGDFGIYLSRPCFWLCWFIFTVEIIAEGIYFLPYSLPHLQNMAPPQKRRSSRHIVATGAWRFVLEGSLSIALISIVAKGKFYPFDLPEDICDGVCRRNTKRLLTLTCIASIAQAAGILLGPLQSFSYVLLPPLLWYAIVLLVLGTIAASVYIIVLPLTISRERRPFVLFLYVIILICAVRREWPHTVVWWIGKPIVLTMKQLAIVVYNNILLPIGRLFNQYHH